jgi:hypothetical protein
MGVPPHLSEAQLSAFRTGTLPADALLEVDDHLAACEACREKLAPGSGLGKAFEAVRAEIRAGVMATHLTYEQIERYVDGRADDVEREVADSHFDGCRQCADETADLTDFRATGAPPIRRPARTVQAFPWLLLPVAAALLWGATLLIRGTDGPGKPPVPTQAEIPPSPPAVRVALDDGGQRVTLDEDGRLAGLPALSPADEASIRAALETGRLEAAGFLAGLAGQSGTLLGGDSGAGTFTLVEPAGTAVETDRPTLRWQRLEGASSYTVAVFDARLDPVATSPALTGSEWTVPKDLERGQNFTWQVTALKGGREITAPAPPAPEARFRVLDQNLTDEIRRLRPLCQGSHLALGIVYARTGLLPEAERELHALSDLNPGSPVARTLLQQVQALRKTTRQSPRR